MYTYIFFQMRWKSNLEYKTCSSTFLYNFAKLHSTSDMKCWNGTWRYFFNFHLWKDDCLACLATSRIINFFLTKKLLFRFEEERALEFRVPVLPLIILFHFSFSVSNTISGANQQNTRHWFICLFRYAHLLVIFFK